MVAAADLPSYSLICEYLGEVRINREIIFHDNDSIMELLNTGDSETSLSIMPEKYSNVGRFFNGINNKKKGSKKR